MYDVAINSLQSHKLVVGSMVIKYDTVATKKTIQPVILFQSLNLFILLFFYFYAFKPANIIIFAG